jgi:hypothetical protein
MTHTATNAIKRVAKALIAGVIPILMFEKITRGNVVAPGPVRKLAITTSSSDKVNANNHPDINDFRRRGTLMYMKDTIALAPRLRADSSTDLSSAIKLDFMFL